MNLNYRKTQVNGTIYVTGCVYVDPNRIAELESGVDEMYLTHINKRCTVDRIMQVAAELGDVYMLRFKIDYTGCSRGYAYLQYVENRPLTKETLQALFRMSNLKIQVRQSRNRKELVLDNVNHLTPLQVHQELRLISNYVKLCVYEYLPKQYIYVIIYRNNDEAAMAHHLLRTKLGVFGVSAHIDWLVKGKPITQPEEQPKTCCVHLSRYSEQLQASANSCLCFRI